MKRDFALRIDSLLGGVRSSLDAVVEYMRHHVQRGDLSDEEFKKYCHFIGKSLIGTISVFRMTSTASIPILHLMS